MAENENIYTDVKALMYFGKSYLKVPRVIIERMFASDNSERMIGIVHWLLFCLCNYADGYVSIKGKQVLCRRGECFITYEQLARFMEVDSRSVRRYVSSLESESLVEVKRAAYSINRDIQRSFRDLEQAVQPDEFSVETQKPVKAPKSKSEKEAER